MAEITSPTLTDKQERFVVLYVECLNATMAARAAGYSKDSARQAGAACMSNPAIRELIEAELDRRATKGRAYSKRILNRLFEQFEADQADIFDEDGQLLPVEEWPPVWRRGLVVGIEIEELFEGRGDDREHIGRLHKIKFADRQRITELLGKHVDVQAFKDKVDHDASDPLKEFMARISGKSIAPTDDGSGRTAAGAGDAPAGPALGYAEPRR